MKQYYATTLFGLELTVRYDYGYPDDLEAPVSLLNLVRPVCTVFLDGKQVDSLCAVPVGEDPPDDYDFVKRVEHGDETYDMYVKWSKPNDRSWQEFISAYPPVKKPH